MNTISKSQIKQIVSGVTGRLADGQRISADQVEEIRRRLTQAGFELTAYAPTSADDGSYSPLHALCEIADGPYTSYVFADTSWAQAQRARAIDARAARRRRRESGITRAAARRIARAYNAALRRNLSGGQLVFDRTGEGGAWHSDNAMIDGDEYLIIPLSGYDTITVADAYRMLEEDAQERRDREMERAAA